MPVGVSLLAIASYQLADRCESTAIAIRLIATDKGEPAKASANKNARQMPGVFVKTC
jgi:hypothetical protein